MTAMRQIAASATEVPLASSLTRLWDWATAEPNQIYFRLLFEIDGLSMFSQLRFPPDARREGVTVWIEMIHEADRRGGSGANAPGRATFIWATISGLLQEYLSIGDRERTTQAFYFFLRCPALQTPPKRK